MAIRKMSGKYQVTVYTGIDPITGKENRKYLGTFKTIREARKIENTFKEALNSGSHVEVTDKTLDEGAEIYFDTVAPYSMNEYSLQQAKMTYEARFKPFLGFIKMRDIKPYQIQQLYTRWLKGDSTEEPLKPSSIRKYHTVLNQIFVAFLEWNELKENPSKKSETSSIK